MPQFNIEKLEQFRPDLEKLLGEYEEELPLPFKLKPDWKQYEALENADILSIITARDNGELLGYFVLIHTPNLNSEGENTSFGATLFLRKEYRKGLLGIRLIKKGEEVANNRGDSCIMISSQAIRPIDKLLELRQYKPTETIFAKRV